MTNERKSDLTLLIILGALLVTGMCLLMGWLIAPMCERAGDSLWRAWKKETQNDYLLKCAEKFNDAARCAEIFTDNDYYGHL